MGRVLRAACILLVLASIVIADVDTKIKKVEFIVNRRTNRRMGYVVTKVRPIDRRNDVVSTETPVVKTTKESKVEQQPKPTPTPNAVIEDIKKKQPEKESSKKIDRNTLSEDDHGVGEMVELEDAPPDAQALETSYAGEIGSSAGQHEDNMGMETFHHHEAHHHQPHYEPHYEKTVTIVRKVPEPYAVEKTVHVPVYKNVPYPVEVPVPEPYPIEKKIHYPVKVLVKVPVRIPKPIAVVHESYYPVHVPIDRMVPHRIYIPEPYPVEQKVFYEVKVPVPEPFPVERKIPVPVKVPVHILQPFPVDKIIPYPVKVEHDRPIPVPVIKPYPVPVTKHVPFPVEKHIPVPVKVKVDNPIPVPYDKPVPVKVEIPQEVPYPVEKKVPYKVEKPVPYPVHVHSEKKDDDSLLNQSSESPNTATSKEPAPIHEDPAERKSNTSSEEADE